MAGAGTESKAKCIPDAGTCRHYRSQADLLTPPDVEAPLPVCTGCKPDIAERLAQAETAAQNARHGRKTRTST